jgi:peptidoglycan/LPS O-acetylase OafA/YrhL
MGTMRLLFALVVVIAHTGGGPPVGNGVLAVQSFYLISGFYMSLILDQKYQSSARGYWLFINQSPISYLVKNNTIDLDSPERSSAFS